jgi:hypothetical protein
MSKMTMTLHEFYHNSLTNRGLWPEEADAIMGEFKSSPLATALADRWNEDAAGYPMAVHAGISMNLDAVALKWIEKNAPKHWAKPMFLMDRPRND